MSAVDSLIPRHADGARPSAAYVKTASGAHGSLPATSGWTSHARPTVLGVALFLPADKPSPPGSKSVRGPCCRAASELVSPSTDLRARGCSGLLCCVRNFWLLLTSSAPPGASDPALRQSLYLYVASGRTCSCPEICFVRQWLAVPACRRGRSRSRAAAADARPHASLADLPSAARRASHSTPKARSTVPPVEMCTCTRHGWKCFHMWC